MRNPTCRRVSQWSVTALFFLLLAVGPAFAGAFNLYYERVVYDSYGNELGYQTQRLNSIDDLPSTSLWRAYLNLLVGDRSIYSYAQSIATSLNMPLNMTISDRNQMSSSSKNSSGYNLKLFRHVTQYSTTNSQRFVFLHELGHVAMLNAYPGSYNFTGLDYGADNVHYIDEVLPNANTAWVEGWANAFAAWKNGGRVFNLDLGSLGTLAFLKGNTFEEMTRNELFTGKAIYDMMRTLPSGKDKVYDVIARTGPHYSLRHFCKAYLSVYPQDQVALANILNQNSFGKMSLHEMLDYLNNGSNQVSRSFYDYLAGAGKLGGTSTGPGTGTGTKTSWWSSIASWFSRVFGGLFNKSSAPAYSETQQAQPPDGSVALGGGSVSVPAQMSDGSAQAASGQSQSPVAIDPSERGPTDLVTAQEAYEKAFAAYTAACAKGSPDSAEAKAARAKLKAAKSTLIRIRKQLGAR